MTPSVLETDKGHGRIENMIVLRRLAMNLHRQIELGPKTVSLRGRLITANHNSAFILMPHSLVPRIEMRMNALMLGWKP